MIVVAKPTPSELQGLIAEGTHHGERTPEEWHRRYLTMTAELLRRRPLDYRAYGPYWWLVKKEMGALGLMKQVSEFFDEEWLELMDYGDTSLNLAAAYGYYAYAFSAGLQSSSRHWYAYHDTEVDEKFGEICWEKAEYVLFDAEMEFIATL